MSVNNYIDVVYLYVVVNKVNMEEHCIVIYMPILTYTESILPFKTETYLNV